MDEFSEQTKRLVSQMQKDMQRIWSGRRGKQRQSEIKAFNIKIGNVIEFRVHELQKLFDLQSETVKKLQDNIEKLMNQKWKLRDERDALLKELQGLKEKDDIRISEL